MLDCSSMIVCPQVKSQSQFAFALHRSNLRRWWRLVRGNINLGRYEMRPWEWIRRYLEHILILTFIYPKKMFRIDIPILPFSKCVQSQALLFSLCHYSRSSRVFSPIMPTFLWTVSPTTNNSANISFQSVLQFRETLFLSHTGQ